MTPGYLTKIRCLFGSTSKDRFKLTEPIETIWIYPTLLEHHLACQKRTQFRFGAKTKALDRMGTRAAAGIVVHRTIESLYSGESFEVAWQSAVLDTHAKLQSAWAPAKVPNPENWELFFILKSRILKRFEAGEFKLNSNHFGQRRIRRESTLNVNGENNNSPGPLPWVEETLFDFEHGLKGVPDQVVDISGDVVVIDHKTSEGQGAPTERQVRQLLFYSWLVKANLGRLPKRGEIRTSRTSTFEIQIEENAVNEVVQQAKKAREIILATLENPEIELPSDASEKHCSFCPFRPACNSFFESVSKDWNAFPAIRGLVSNVEDHEGRFVVDLEVESPEWHAKSFRIVNLSLKNPPQVGSKMAFADYSIRGSCGFANWNTLSFTWESD